MFGKPEETTHKKVNISEIARMSTLSPEEMEEASIEAGEVTSEETESAGVQSYMPASTTAESKAKKRMAHGEPKFVVAAKPDEKTMFDFMFYHSYMNVMGVLSVIIGIAAIAYVIYSLISGAEALQIILFAAIAAMFLANSPFTLKYKAKKQSAQICDEKNTITYTFSDAGFDMARGTDEYAEYDWEHMYKVKEGNLGYYMYLERNRAFVLPKCDIEDNAEFKALLKRHVQKRLMLTEEGK